MKKLSKAQIEMLKLMADGWQLGHDSAFGSRTWLQKGGCGYGGESKTAHWGTVFALWKAELIDLDKEYKYPTRTYHLTDAGLDALKGDSQ